MSFPLIITLISGFLILSIFSIRLIEINTGKFVFSENIRSIRDVEIKKLRLAVLKNIVKIKNVIKKELFFLPKRILKLTHLVWQGTKKRIDRFYDKVCR